MSDAWIRHGVRTLLALMPRATADRQSRTLLARYDAVAARLDKACSTCATIPAMPGIDEDMREWSFYMVLEHNVIVNRSITAVVESLALGQPLPDEARIDPKHDVMPSSTPGPEQIAAFRSSVENHVQRVAALGPLRGTRTERHPLFGDLDAHRWNGFFAFHMALHLRQAHALAKMLSPTTSP